MTHAREIDPEEGASPGHDAILTRRPVAGLAAVAIGTLGTGVTFAQEATPPGGHGATPVADDPTPFEGESVTTMVYEGERPGTVSIQPGETQRWRIANLSADRFFFLALEGHHLHQIASDGCPYNHVVLRDTILLAPAERAEVMV